MTSTRHAYSSASRPSADGIARVLTQEQGKPLAEARGEVMFGGIKDSGYGSEGGPEDLEAYLDVRAVSIASV